MKKLTLLLFFGLLYTFQSQAQGTGVRGQVIDQEGKVLPGAYVILTRGYDSLQRAASTDASGRFLIEQMRPGKYELKVTFVGYKNLQKVVILGMSMKDLGKLSLNPNPMQLEQVEVVDKAVAAIQKGDTTELNANAYKTNPDANAQDLLEKMPGIVNQNGEVQAQGERVQKVLVDGKEFFGTDPNAALKNIPAEIISKIQVFDQQSEQAQFTGFDDGQAVKTINIVTKPSMRNGNFGRFYAGYGTDDRYKAGGNFNRFDKDLRLSIIGQSNNINIQNFSSDDLLGVVSSSQGSGRRRFRGGGRGSNVNNFLVGEQNGIIQTHALGVNYSDDFGKNLKVESSYFFNMSDNDAFQNLNRETYLRSGNSQFYEENSFTGSQNINHRFNLRLEYQISRRASIIWRPRITLQENEGTETIFGQTSFMEDLLNQTDNRYTSDLNALNFNNSLLYRQRFAKRGRTLSLRLRTTYNQNSGESFLNSENQFFDPTSIEEIDQFSDLETDGLEISGNINYTEPINRRNALMLMYNVSWQDNSSNQETFNFSDNEQDFTILDTTLSNIFENQYTTHQIGTGWRYFSRKLVFMVRASYQYAVLDGSQSFPFSDDLSRSFNNIVPMAFGRLRISQQKNLRFFYRGNTTAPSVNQLQDVIDNSNPLQLSSGNPDLNQSYQHRLFIRYNANNPEKSTVFFTLLGGTYTSDYIANSIFIAEEDTLIREDIVLQQGSQLSQPVNMNGYWNLRSFLTYGMPLGFLKSNLNFNLSANYIRTPGLINNAENIAHNQTYGLGITLSSNISEDVDFTFSSNSNYNIVTNTLREDLNDNYLNQTTRVKFYWRIWKGLVFRTNLDHQLYTGLSEGFNQNYWLWNASLGVKMFKNRRGEINLSVFDLLKQNQSITRNITESYLEDVQTDVLQRYFMLTFIYNLRAFKGLNNQNNSGFGNGRPDSFRRR